MVVLVELFAMFGARDLSAQSVTTAALYGVVHGPDSSGIRDAVVTVTNLTDGGRWRTTTRTDGRYGFEYLSVGGPYAIEARAIGSRGGVPVALEDGGAGGLDQGRCHARVASILSVHGDGHDRQDAKPLVDRANDRSQFR
jgi:hypothetical protein